ncbi:hypothetical protein Csa_003911 [Cucumis sativus]|uniref:Uncharacterized protein n=1 Tax=Cucumis sativus TaxID=3659 RepID=A0A0A0KLT6_CUCSA|nr:hypothetical protein Csa_003911 [Cucumis sativus]
MGVQITKYYCLISYIVVVIAMMEFQQPNSSINPRLIIPSPSLSFFPRLFSSRGALRPLFDAFILPLLHLFNLHSSAAAAALYSILVNFEMSSSYILPYLVEECHFSEGLGRF